MKAAVITCLFLLGIGGQGYGQKIDTPSIKQLTKYMADHIRYPVLAKENDVVGKVLISFKLNTDKSISDIKKIKEIGSGCDSEVVRVLKNYSGKLNLSPSIYSFSIEFLMTDGDVSGDVTNSEDVSNLRDILKNFLFEARILGYRSIKKKSYIIDISKVSPRFDDRTGKVKAMTISTYTGNIFASKTVQKFDVRKRLTESISYNEKNLLIWNTTYIYNSSEYEVLTKNAKGQLLIKELYSDRPQRIIQRIYYNNENGSINSKTVYTYNNKGALLTSIEYAADDRIRFMAINKIDTKGQKIEEDDYNSEIELTGKRTFRYNEKGELESDANCEKDGSVIYENIYVYNDLHQKVKSYFNVPANGVSLCNTFKYDLKGRKIEEVADISSQNLTGKKNTFNYTEVDKQGNWHKAICIDADVTTIVKREIVYHL